MIALYLRQSVERDNSMSIETQLDFCRSMIRPDEREEAVKVYTDEGMSGSNTNRKGFLSMMQDIKEGKIRKVITYKLDRISRSLGDFVGILKTFEEHHVEFVSSQEAFDTSSSYGELVLKILMVFAEFERTSIINRVKDAYAKRTDEGIYMGGRRQYGFRLEDWEINGIPTKRYIAEPKEAEQIRYIFSCYSKEQTTLRQVRDRLINRNMLPLDGSSWTTQKLSSLMKNPVYVRADSSIYTYYQEKGVRMVNSPLEFDGVRGAKLYGRSKHDSTLPDWSDLKLVLLDHEGLVSSKTWLICQDKLLQNKRFGTSLTNDSSWLSGKVTCGLCGATLTTIKSKRKDGSCRRYFVCPGKTHKKTCTGLCYTVYAEDMEHLLEEKILEKLSLLQCVKRRKIPKDSAYLDLLKKRLLELKDKEQKLFQLLLKESLHDDFIKEANLQMEILRRQRISLQSRLEQEYQSMQDQDQKENLLLYWHKSSGTVKKAVVNLLIYGIILYEDRSMEIIWTR